MVCMLSTCFASLEKGHKSLLALKSIVNILRAQLGLTPISSDQSISAEWEEKEE